MTSLGPEQQAALEQLRDIRLPEAVGLWPLAPGWWALVAFAVLLAVACIGWTILHRRTRRFAAMRELERLRQRYETDPPPAVAADLAALVRRVALSASEERVARLSDAEWAGFLASGKAGLPSDIAEFLAQAPYRRPDGVTAERLSALFKPAELWIRRTA